VNDIEPVVTPYGAWPSPITAARLVEGAANVSELRVDGDDVWWSEARPAEAGLTQLVRRTPDGIRHDVLPDGWNARTQVHEYGGGAWCVRDGVVWFSRWNDQRMYRLDTGSSDEPQPITPEPALARGLRWADAAVSPDGRTLVCVRERHESDGERLDEAVNELVSVPADGSAADDPIAVRVVVSGPDFVASPRISPDGSSLAWIRWNHPDMPWDGTELCVGRLRPSGGVSDVRVVAGSRTESVMQPEFDHEGRLWFVSDRSGWWNLHRLADDGSIRPVSPMEAEIGGPQWVFGLRGYALLPDGQVACAVTGNGLTGVTLLRPTSAGPDARWERIDVESPLTVAGQVAPGPSGDGIVLVGASPRAELAPLHIEVDGTSACITELRPPRDLGIDPAYFSQPETISFATSGGTTAHALVYPPTNPDVRAPDGELPPLLVLSHGGPTSAARPMLDLTRQFWTSRGFVVADVNYRGSTGYGTAYRRQLDLHWGIVDVDDCVAAAKFLAERGSVDPKRLAIRGGSAGGFTTLCALTFARAFAVGASHYGVADLAALAKDTHKFESRYLDRMVGPWPEASDEYFERSPIHHTELLARPLIIFQGLEDEVVPPNQAEMMAAALDAKGVPHAYVPFDGEQHGFRQAPNIIRALEAELWFYGRILGFEPADPIEPVEAKHLR
jgi:dipeptidyl aminopeptidase/acylaminoacyl peptidase